MFEEHLYPNPYSRIGTITNDYFCRLNVALTNNSWIEGQN